MNYPFSSKYRLITISGKVAVGTTTLAKNLSANNCSFSKSSGTAMDSRFRLSSWMALTI